MTISATSSDHQIVAPAPGQLSYTIYGGELSLFTRKLEAAAKFYGMRFDLRSKTAANSEHIQTRSGTHQVPVLHTPENWLIGDTTPLLKMLDSRHPGREMFPPGATGALVHVLEEFFDEWVARVMVHYRWHYPASAEFASRRMANGDEAAAARVRDWGPRACRATGTESTTQQAAAEAEYLRLMSAAEEQLKSSAYLLGDRPTAVDCIVLGGLRAHTLMDPDPAKVMQQFPTLIDWAERGADEWNGGGELAPASQPTGFARSVLKEIVGTYKPYILANSQALAAGAKACHASIYDEAVSFLTRPYPETSRLMVSQTLAALAPSERRTMDQLLADYEADECFG